MSSIRKTCSQLRLLGPSKYYAMTKAKKAYVKAHDACEITGEKHDLEVHHKKKVELYPELADDPTNLITLCSKANIHFLVGHLKDFHKQNDNIDSDARILSQMFSSILESDGPDSMIGGAE